MMGFVSYTEAFQAVNSDSSDSSISIDPKKQRLNVLETDIAHELRTLFGEDSESENVVVNNAITSDSETTIISDNIDSDISDSDIDIPNTNQLYPTDSDANDAESDEQSGNSNHPPYSTLSSTNSPTPTNLDTN